MFRAFFFRRPVTLEFATTCSLPRGGGLGRGHPRISAIFSNTLTAQRQALRLVALSLALSHGREDGAAVGVKGSARKQVVQAAFYFSDDLKSTAVNPSCFLNRLPTAKSAAIRSLPCGEGWGEGILQIAAIFPKSLSLLKYKPCGLLPSL